jgi:hypothetical protein
MARRKKPEKKGQIEAAASGQCLKCRKIISVGAGGLVKKHRNRAGGLCVGIGSVAGPPPPKFGACPVCHVNVAKDEVGRIGEHQSGERQCRGTGRVEYNGPPVGICEACGAFRRLRATDGRLVSHQVDGNQCEGSGKTPSSGRAPRYMTKLTVSVLRGGLPGSGKRKR